MTDPLAFFNSADVKGHSGASLHGVTTAAGIETLLAANPALAGYAGATHPVDTTPHWTQPGRTLRGNGATLYSPNADSVGVGGDGAAMTLGCSTIEDFQQLTQYAVAAIDGLDVTLSVAGSGADFVVGEIVVPFGTTSYPGAGGFALYRNWRPAHVTAIVGDVLTLDRNPPAEVVADAPVKIVRVNEGVACASAIANPGFFYWADRPKICDTKFLADQSYASRLQGVVDGTFKDNIQVGRNALVANALANCSFSRWTCLVYNKGIELAQGSYGVTVDDFTVDMWDNPAHPSTAAFLNRISENSAHNRVRRYKFNGGSIDYLGNIGGFVILGGYDNELSDALLQLPSHTGQGLAVSAPSTAGNPVTDGGFRNCRVDGGANLTIFFSCVDNGGGIVRPYCIASRFTGTVSTSAAQLMGTDGRLIDNWFGDGGVTIDAACTGWAVVDNYLPDGFTNLTQAKLQANPRIRDNESDASRRMTTASYVSEFGTTGTVTATAANTVYASAAFAAGDLKAGDVVTLYSQAYTVAGTGTNRKVRPSTTSGGTTTGMTTITVTDSAPIGVDLQITVISNSVIAYSGWIGSTRYEGVRSALDLDANGLTVNLEYWVANAAEPITVRKCHIVGRKPGMAHPPLK